MDVLVDGAALGVPAEVDRGLALAGFTAPFAIQVEAVPVALTGKDVCGRARTGSGKTLAFALPMVARIADLGQRPASKRPWGLVLVPTRELAAQVCGELEWLGRGAKLRAAAVYGGAGFGKQLQALRSMWKLFAMNTWRKVLCLQRLTPSWKLMVTPKSS